MNRSRDYDSEIWEPGFEVIKDKEADTIIIERATCMLELSVILTEEMQVSRWKIA